MGTGADAEWVLLGEDRAGVCSFAGGCLNDWESAWPAGQVVHAEGREASGSSQSGPVVEARGAVSVSYGLAQTLIRLLVCGLP